jgi:ferritin-like metal-binding protein YciE
MTIATSSDVFFDQLRDLKSATEQTIQTMPDLIGWADHARLREAFDAYHAETSRHLQEILAIFEAHSKDPGKDQCKAVAGLIEGGNAHIEMAGDGMVRNLLLIAHTNRLGHYLRAAAEFTLGMARKCSLTAETDVIARMLARHQDFTGWLAEVAAEAFEVEIGGIR